ncbi:MAG: hypothetical protein V3U34_00660 [candidate division NC10 bacterium]
MRSPWQDVVTGFVGDLPQLRPGTYCTLRWDFDCILHAQQGDKWSVEVPLAAGTRLILESVFADGRLQTRLRPAAPLPTEH